MNKNIKYFKLKMIEKDFSFNKNKISCYQEWEINIPRTIKEIIISNKELSKLFEDNNILQTTYSYIIGNYIIITSSSIAKCHENDTYDKKKGMHIAETKTEKKIYNKYNKIMKLIKKVINDSIIEKLNNTISISEKYYNNQKEHLEKLINN